MKIIKLLIIENTNGLHQLFLVNSQSKRKL